MEKKTVVNTTTTFKHDWPRERIELILKTHLTNTYPNEFPMAKLDEIAIDFDCAGGILVGAQFELVHETSETL